MKFYSLANRNMKEIYRDPITLLLGIAMPVGLLVIFSSIYKRSQFEMFSPQSLTPGIVIFSFAFLIMFSATLLAKDKQSAFLIRLFATPLRPSDFILSYLLPFIPIALFQTVVCFVVGILLGATFSNVLLAFIIFFLIALSCISTGIIMGSLLTINQVSGVGALLITVISLFSGAWMDLKMVGGIFELIGYALPFAHGVDASKGLLTGGSFAVIAGNFYWILTYAAALTVLAILSFKWVMKKD